MKLGLTIKKNIKMLLRTRISALVLVLGPLLIILLVGLSFNSNTFSLNLGVYSDSYSDLSRNFITKLNNESFAVTQIDSELNCINSVKEQKIHACIIFPPDLSLENDKANNIKFHVDQSKINLVYLIMSTLEESFSEVSTDLSKDLTENIVTTLFMTKAGLIDSEELINSIKEKNDVVLDNSQKSSTSLDGLNFDTSGASVSISTTATEEKLDLLLEDSLEIIEEAIEIIEEFDTTNMNSSQRGDLDDIEELLTDDLKNEISDGHNDTVTELILITEQLESSLGALASKLEDAEDVNKDVITKLNLMKTNAQNIKEKADSLSSEITSMISNINSVQITNTENIVSPITTEIIPVVQTDSNLGYIFPSLIVILIMFIGLLLPSTLIIMEKNSRAFFRLFTTPTKPNLHVIATYLTSLMILSLQVIIILAVSQFYFKISFLNSFGMLLLSLIIIMSLFIFIGMFLGYLFNTEEMSMLSSVSIATLLLLTSGIVFPIESMPKYVIEKIKYNPVVSGSELFRKAILFTSDFDSVKESFGILLVTMLLVLVLIYIVKKIDKLNLKREKIDKKLLEKKFLFGERTAKSLPEFIVSIQNLDQKRFQHLLDEDSFKNWIKFILRNGKTAKKIEKITTKEELLEILVEELKNNKK